MDALLLRRLVAELDERLAGRRIDQVYAVPRDHLAIVLGQKGAPRLWFSSEPEHPHLYVRNGSHPAPQRPPAFAMAARKLLSGRRIAGLSCPEGERIVDLRFAGDTGERLVYEMIPRRATAMVVDGDGRVRAVWHPRRSRPDVGDEYAVPQLGNRRAAADLSASDWELVQASPEVDDLARALLRTIEGMSGLTAREAAWSHAAGAPLRAAVAAELERARDEPTAARVYAPVDPHTLGELPAARRFVLAPYPMRHLESGDDALHGAAFDSLLEAASFYYPERARLSALDEARQRLRNGADNEAARLQRTADAIVDDDDSLGDPDTYRRRGDLLLAHPDAARRGDIATVPDDYGDGEPLEIGINPETTLIENAQVYYRKAQRAERSRAHTAKRRAMLEKRIDRLRDLGAAAAALDSLERADHLARQALRLGARVKPQYWQDAEARGQDEEATLSGADLEEGKSGQRARPPAEQRRSGPAPGILGFTGADGSEILVGRNAAANERLTHKLATPHDFWLHAEGPGSHVVIRNPQRAADPDEETLRQAASLAAHFSFARGSTKVNVRWTQVRHLRKPRGGPKGQVILKKAHTVLAEPKGPGDLFG